MSENCRGVSSQRKSTSGHLNVVSLSKKAGWQTNSVVRKRQGNSFNTTNRDEYYTQPEDIQWAISKIPDLNKHKWLDPSGGDGRFLDYLPFGSEAWDIEPRSSRVKKVKDSLQLNWSGYNIIGNPPFSLWREFVNKALAECGECWLILPASTVRLEGKGINGIMDVAYCRKKKAGKFWVPALKFSIESTGQTKEVFAIWAHFRKAELGEVPPKLKVHYLKNDRSVDRSRYFNYSRGQYFDMPDFLIAE